jgi:hypothetical protein
MNNLHPMFDESVLMNTAALEDLAVLEMLTRQSLNNFEFKNVSQDSVTFDEFIGKGN